jgi:hypothetical protein
MTDKKISELPTITGANLTETDLIPVVDVSSNATSKVTRDEFFKNIPANMEILDSIVHSGDTNTKIRFLTNDTVTVETNGSERMRITSTGFVGIGTTVPDVGLHYTGDTPKLRIESTNDLSDTLGTEEIGRIEWEGTRGSNRNVPASIRVQQAGTWSTVTPWFSPTSMAFYTQDNSGVQVTSPRLFIGSTGNVGIGTSSPGSKLSVVGLPTSSAGLSAGDIWNDGGTLKIV